MDHGTPTNNTLFDNEIINVKQAARFLGVSEKTIYAKVNDGTLPHRRIGSSIKFLRSELIKFLKGA